MNTTTTSSTDTDIIDRISELVDWQLAQRQPTQAAETPAPRFPVADEPRTTDPGRQVIENIGYLEPLDAATDMFVSVPIRLVANQAAGLCIELAGYDLDVRDVGKLRAAIAAYDDVSHAPADQYRSRPTRRG